MAGSERKKTRSVRTFVMLPNESYGRIQALAEANDVSSAWWVIRLLIPKFLHQQNGQFHLPLLAGHR